MIDWLIENKDFATLVFSGVVTISTVVYAILTASLVKETVKMRRAQTEPKLVVYFMPREEFVNFGHLYIKNIGLGPAFDISIAITPVDSMVGSKLLLDDFTKVKAFKSGLNYLGPNQVLQSGLTSMVEGYQEKIKAVLKVSLSYKSTDNAKKTDTFHFDFSELEGYGSLGKPHLYSIAQSLEKIQKDLHHLTTGFHKLKVQTFSHEDRERERQEWEDARQQMMKDKPEGE